MDTLALDRTTWDLFLDARGDIAVASNPYSLAQDAASAIRLFSGELYYDTTQGVPYFGQILGQMPPLEFMKAQFVGADDARDHGRSLFHLGHQRPHADRSGADRQRRGRRRGDVLR
jgi:hypothetical protein